MFLIETKCNREKLDLIRNKIGFDRNFVVNSKGWCGGLALLWNSTLEVDLESFTYWHISAMITLPIEEKKWLFTRFYGNTATTKRKES